MSFVVAFGLRFSANADSKPPTQRAARGDCRRVFVRPSAPAAYFGRCQTILPERERIKRDNIKQGRLRHHSKAA
jgi:hypothetical protein